MNALKTAALLLALSALTNCNANRVGEPFGREPAVETERQRLGEATYMQHCHQCHPHGEAGLAPKLNDKPLPEFLIALQVRQGFGVMPSFGESEISEEQLDALTDYVVALRTAAQHP